MATAGLARNSVGVILPAMPQIRSRPPSASGTTAPTSRPLRAALMLLGVAMLAVGVGVLAVQVMTLLIHTPGWIYASLFVTGARAAEMRQPFNQAVLYGVAMFAFAAYGVVLFLCGAYDWRVPKASFWYGVVMAMLAASAALMVGWNAFANAGA